MSIELNSQSVGQADCHLSEIQALNQDGSDQSVADHSELNKQEPLIICYTRGLKAMLDVLPENTDAYSEQTIGHYLWVIEQLLSNIYRILEETPELDPDQMMNDFENRSQNMLFSAVSEISSNKSEN